MITAFCALGQLHSVLKICRKVRKKAGCLNLSILESKNGYWCHACLWIGEKSISVAGNSYDISFLLTSWVPQTKLIFMCCSENPSWSIDATCQWNHVWNLATLRLIFRWKQQSRLAQLSVWGADVAADRVGPLDRWTTTIKTFCASSTCCCRSLKCPAAFHA